MVKVFIASRLTSTMAWTSVAILIAALFLPRIVIITLAVILFFIPDRLIDSTIAKIAPSLKRKLDAWQ